MAARITAEPECEVVDALTLIDLCRISGSRADWIIELVDEGILEPVGPGRTSWRFESSSIAVIAKVRRLQSDLRINIPGAALALALADENARLLRHLMQLDRDLARTGRDGETDG